MTQPDRARQSASSRTPTAKPREAGPVGGYPLAGPTQALDPRIHAYRDDLADAALAGSVVASHYADPLEKRLKCATELRAAPAGDEVVASLAAGDVLLMLDCTRGWAWGYAGPERLVGYVDFTAL